MIPMFSALSSIGSITLLEVMLGLVRGVGISILYLKNQEVSDIGKISVLLSYARDRKVRDCTWIACTHLRVNKGSGRRDKEVGFHSIAIRSFQTRTKTF